MTDKTVLYYAMGGGLGHITRTFAILEEVDNTANINFRILASSRLTHLVKGHEPYPMDEVPYEFLKSRKKYLKYIKEYLKKYDIKAIVIDTFPWGIVGEWKNLALNIPRLLIARSLKWDEYKKRMGFKYGQFPQQCLTIERQEATYEKIISSESKMTRIYAPIVYTESRVAQNRKLLRPDPQQNNSHSQNPPSSSDRRKWLVVHTGDRLEQKKLLKFAKNKMKELGCTNSSLHSVFPIQRIFPASDLIKDYSYIVSGAGYNMAAMACVAGSEQKYFLLPFFRRFDDQFTRARLIQAGGWQYNKREGAKKAGKWLIESL
ncbi:hypothetical protein QUF76_04500 [Desulfobacterales bacterium HSG16]|nr:hypothetical protein [Desulfobacterales bacterium HSG16]